MATPPPINPDQTLNRIHAVLGNVHKAVNIMVHNDDYAGLDALATQLEALQFGPVVTIFVMKAANPAPTP